MKAILAYLAGDGAFLYAGHGFRVVDSCYDPAFGGVGAVTLTDGVVGLLLALDRDRLTAAFRGAGRRSPRAWFSLDMVRQLLTGEPGGGSSLDADGTEYLRKRLGEIRDRFAKPTLQSTEKTLQRFERQRAKRLFG